ncbi:hypothetical protein B0H16DRAFT_1781918 [Mycena metata]|uniref:Uncharacterized protein n=1 Tax=Mycena metata TaxID=1033252 RepID=A0AAD7MND8_9AGAR|nr:hypothetical protein B0H16DRAFT_1781918 [Mycena metata]
MAPETLDYELPLNPKDQIGLSAGPCESGILLNSQNESSDRRTRNTTRQSTAAQKSRESHDAADERAEVDREIQALQAEKQHAEAKLKKDLRTRKSALSTKSKGSQTRSVAASSSGRVKTRTIVSNSTPPRSITPDPTSPVASTSTLPPEINQTVLSSEAPYHYSPPTMALADNYFLAPPANEFLSTSYFPQTSGLPCSDFGVYAPPPAPSAFGDYGGSNFDFDYSLLAQFGYVPMDLPPAPAPTFPQAGFTFDSASPAPLDAFTMPGFNTSTLLPSDPPTTVSSPGASWPRLPPVPVSLPTPLDFKPSRKLPHQCDRRDEVPHMAELMSHETRSLPKIIPIWIHFRSLQLKSFNVSSATSIVSPSRLGLDRSQSYG